VLAADGVHEVPPYGLFAVAIGVPAAISRVCTGSADSDVPPGLRTAGGGEMRIKSLFVVVAIAAAGLLAAAAPASASDDGRSYDVICIEETLPGGHPLPEVCLPYPL
jgi:hypothetical protein